MSLLGRLNYINRFTAKLTTTCDPISSCLKKTMFKWSDKYEEAFDNINEYPTNIHVPSQISRPLFRPLFLYLTMINYSFEYMLGNMISLVKENKRSII